MKPSGSFFEVNMKLFGKRKKAPSMIRRGLYVSMCCMMTLQAFVTTLKHWRGVMA